jgi:hypothetical protein
MMELGSERAPLIQEIKVFVYPPFDVMRKEIKQLSKE